jgi:hypothetical protein
MQAETASVDMTATITGCTISFLRMNLPISTLQLGKINYPKYTLKIVTNPFFLFKLTLFHGIAPLNIPLLNGEKADWQTVLEVSSFIRTKKAISSSHHVKFALQQKKLHELLPVAPIVVKT